MVACVLGAGALVGLLPSLTVDRADAGAWTQEKGKGVSIVTSSFSYGTASFDESGRLRPVHEYRKFELSQYAEYGVTPWLTGLLRGEMRTATNSRILSESATAGAIGARVRLHHGPNRVLSAQLTGLTGDLDTLGLGSATDAAGFDARVLFGYAYTLWSVPAYVDVQTGYRWRSGDSPDEVRLDLTLGVKPTENWELTLQSFNVFSTEPAGLAAGGSYRYHKLNLGVLRHVNDRLSVQATGFGVAHGANALQEFGGGLSVWYHF